MQSILSGNYPRVSSPGEYEAWQIGHLYRRYSNQDFRQSRWKACLQRFSTSILLSGGECCAPQLQRGSGRVVGLRLCWPWDRTAGSGQARYGEEDSADRQMGLGELA